MQGMIAPTADEVLHFVAQRKRGDIGGLVADEVAISRYQNDNAKTKQLNDENHFAMLHGDRITPTKVNDT